MAALLAGLKTSLYMINRLKAYMDYLRDLPVTQTRDNFETALTELHALILQFLARTIQSYQKSALTHGFGAFWKPEEVRNLGMSVIELRNGSRSMLVIVTGL